MHQKTRAGPRLGGKRRHPVSTSATEGSTFLILENRPPPRAPDDNVVDKAKVKQYLHKLTPKQEENPSACIKCVFSNTESRKLTPELQDELQREFEISSVSVSEENALSVDQIVTIHGNLQQVLRAVLYLSFWLTSEVNNVVRAESFTLKSANYHMDILIEASVLQMEALARKFPLLAIDHSSYESNRDLHLATLSGDFTSLFNSLIHIFLRFAYVKYLAKPVEQWPVIGTHDGDKLFQPTDANREKLAKNKNEVLLFIYNSSFLDKLN